MSLLPAEGGETLSFETAKVHRVTFDLEYSSVDNVEAAAGEVTLLNHGGIVTITAPGNFTFGAWDMNGRSICSGSAQGQTALDFTSQPKGVYVIRAAGNTIKFINK